MKIPNILKNPTVQEYLLLIALLLIFSLALFSSYINASGQASCESVLECLSVAQIRNPAAPSGQSNLRSTPRAHSGLAQTVSKMDSCPAGTIYSPTYFDGTPRVPGTYTWEDGSYQVGLCVGCFSGYPCDQE